MFELFKKDTKQKESIPKSRNFGIYCLIIAAVMLVGGVIQGFLLVPFLNADSMQDVESTLNSEPVMLYNLYLSAVTSALILFIGIKKDKRSFESMGLTRTHVIRHYLLGHLTGFLTLSFSLLMTICLGGAVFKGIDLQAPSLLILYFIGFMLQGFEEELMCRGFMMFGLSKSYSIFFSMMANSLFFAALHLGNPGIQILPLINLFLAGLSFSCMAVYFDDIWMASGAHSMWNFAQGNIYGILVSGMSMGPTIFKFELSGQAWISGGNFGLEGGIGVFITEILTILIFCFLYKYKKNKEIVQ